MPHNSILSEAGNNQLLYNRTFSLNYYPNFGYNSSLKYQNHGIFNGLLVPKYFSIKLLSNNEEPFISFSNSEL